MIAKRLNQVSYVINITLQGTEPSVWRRFCVPGDISLDRLHDVIQIIMGWEERHMHCFKINGCTYTEAPEDPETDGEEQSDFKLLDLVPRATMTFTYDYDFGDGWHHSLAVESVTEVSNEQRAYLGCLDGKRRCPPEDVGGIERFQEFLDAIREPRHLEHESFREWWGGQFDAAAFDLEAVNRELAKYARWTRPRGVSQVLMVRPETFLGRRTSMP